MFPSVICFFSVVCKLGSKFGALLNLTVHVNVQNDTLCGRREEEKGLIRRGGATLKGVFGSF